MASDFNRNVFVNCPFDAEYRELLIGITFTIIYFGYKPRLALERADSAEPRIDKILELINESKFGIHDLSRLMATEKDEPYRMNMPFELGIDYGCQRLRGGKWAGKKYSFLRRSDIGFRRLFPTCPART